MVVVLDKSKARSSSLSYCAIDTETTGLDVYGKDRATSAAWYNDKGVGDVMKVTDSRFSWFGTFLLRSPQIVKVFWNAKFDIQVFRMLRMPTQMPFVDALLLARIVHSGEKSYSLKHFARKFLGDLYEEETKIKAWAKKHKKGIGEAPDYLLKPYNLKDATMTLVLWQLMWEEANKAQRKLFKNEMKVLRCTMDMERRGLLIDIPKCEKLLPRARKEAATVKKQIAKKLNKPSFNPGSHPQVRKAVYDGNSKVEWRTKGGEAATHKVALVGTGHPIAKKILKYRELDKLRGTYLEGMLSRQIGGVVRPSWNQAGTKTGRYSSSEPNFQNLPRVGTSPLGCVRNLVIARPGYRLILIDYEQLEIRICAHHSQEEVLLDAINAGKDVHGETCRKIFNKNPKSPSWDKFRFYAKTLNFSQQYGCGPSRLRYIMADQGINISEYRAAKLVEAYRNGYPKVMALFDTTASEVAETGGITNSYGRYIEVDRGEVYVAVNYLVQGDAADLIKHKMPHCRKALHGRDAWMVLQVHDELGFEINEDELDLVRDLRDIMIEPHKFCVPITCDVKQAKRWGKKRKFTITS